MAKLFYLLSAFGKDRPGIVAHVTRVLFAAGVNIEDASMTRLGGEFTMMLIVGAPDLKTSRTLPKALRPLETKFKLSVSIKPLKNAPALREGVSDPTHLISVYGADRPGIVYRVTQLLANRKINITDLNTKITPRAGQSFYVMLLEVNIALDTDMDELRAHLEQIGRFMQLEVTLQHIEPVAL